MKDGESRYDTWKLKNQEDEENDRQRIIEREEELADRADYMRDREKDERYEREEHNRECDRQFDLNGGEE